MFNIVQMAGQVSLEVRYVYPLYGKPSLTKLHSLPDGISYDIALTSIQDNLTKLEAIQVDLTKLKTASQFKLT